MKRVFIVEDEAIVAMELKDRLGEMGYEVCGHVARGEAALRQIPEVRPDLVLMDIHLGPGMTGLDVAEQLRAVLDVPVIFITAYSDAELTARAGRSGSFAYIVKPFDARVLGANIELALARHAAQAQLRQSQERLERDIAARMRTEERLHAAVEAREDLLAVVSHDLRTPLSAIEMSARYLAHAPLAGEQRATQRSVNVILRSAERMSRMVADLLQAAAIEAGKLTVDPGLEDVRSIIEEALHAFESAAAARSVSLRQDVPEGLPRLPCDRLRVIQVLSNLVGNALKFVPSGGNIQVRAWAQADEVCFAVRDDGPGIAPDHVHHIFDRYWKGEAEGRRGVGLGLYIAKGIVEAHGGRIWVESQAGAGSTFHFTIPLFEPEGGHSEGPRAGQGPRDSQG